MGIANPPADCIAAVDPAAVDTLRPLDLLCANGEQYSPCFWILSTEKKTDWLFWFPKEWKLQKYAIFDTQMINAYLKDNLETVAGHGCATNTSLRAKVGNCSALILIDILATSEGWVRFSRMASNIYTEKIHAQKLV